MYLITDAIPVSVFFRFRLIRQRMSKKIYICFKETLCRIRSGVLLLELEITEVFFSPVRTYGLAPHEENVRVSLGVLGSVICYLFCLFMQV